MKKNCFSVLFFTLILSIVFIKCAKRGTIDGGVKDTIAPKYLWSNPKNFSTDFNSNEIKIYFDEYIKLKDAKKQLIVSPPLKNEPEIFPISAGKFITIKLKDTLLPNTTYSFNFGNSIEDYNEENPFRQFNYVVSTGKMIDSLTLSGLVKDAFNKETDPFVSVLLYEANEKYNDSLIYKTKPRYVTNTLDKSKDFLIQNIKEGKYYLFALKDLNNNLKFEPKTEKIAFYPTPIEIPSKDAYELELFKETLPFKNNKPIIAASNKIILGFEGNYKKPKIEINDFKDKYNYKITKIPNKDSLQIWFKPQKFDSLQVNINEKKYTLLSKKLKADTLTITASQNGRIDFNKDFFISSSTPFEKIDYKKIKLLDKDSISVAFTTRIDTLQNNLHFIFNKTEDQKYQLIIPENTIIDFFQLSNSKPLNFKFYTGLLADFGNLNLEFQNIKSYPFIIELTDSKGKLLHSKNNINASKVSFNLIPPEKFTLRVIYDVNKNGLWDTGNYLKKIQTEEVIYFNKEIDLRANWDVQQTIDLNPK
jgi:hypothetical protein